MGRTGSARSTGCNTCLRRRVKCDERRPACERCQKSGYECKGYVRQHRFVDEVPRTICHKKNTTVVIPSRSNADLVHTPKGSTIPPDLGLAAFKNDICEAYLISNFPVDIARPISWMRIRAPDMTSLAATYSTRALCTAFFGRRHRQGNMLNQAILDYGRALRYLNDDLHNLKMASSLSILSIVTLLTVYEFIIVSDKTGWLKHVGAIGRLIELRGPWKHQALRERRLFEANRINIVVDYLKKGKRCFLEQPEWKTIPWALEPASKTALVYLEDILCDIPGLQADAISLRNPELEPAQRTSSYEALSRNILDHLNELYTWRIRWEKDNPHACVEVLALRPLDEQGLFSTRFYFTNLALAYELIFYNAVLLMLLQLGSGITCPTSNTPSLPSTKARRPLDLACEASNILAVATELCKIAEHIVLASKERPSITLLFSLSVAFLVFPPASREKEWLKDTSKKIADLCGLEIGEVFEW
ncbi:hypothetical protein BDZ45DRAFT_692411 [Acephala macrosclerotiorum]|nr:hypothetical protein BDZ45DRAFT_692411 [Acephala macrosclerotiorum]